MSMMSIDIGDENDNENDNNHENNNENTENNNENKGDNTNLAPKQWVWGDSSNDENQSNSTKETINTNSSSNKYQEKPNDNNNINDNTNGNNNINDNNNISDNNATDNLTNNSNSATDPWSFGALNNNDKDKDNNNNQSNAFTLIASNNNNNDTPNTNCKPNNEFPFGTSTNTDNNTFIPSTFGSSNITTNNNTNNMSFDTSTSTNDKNNNETTEVSFGISNDKKDNTNGVSFNTTNENNNENNNNKKDNTNDISFGITSENKQTNELTNNNNTNNNSGWTFTPTPNETNDNKNDTNKSHPCTFATSNDNQTTNNTNNNNNFNTEYTFGTPINNNQTNTTTEYTFGTPNTNVNTDANNNIDNNNSGIGYTFDTPINNTSTPVTVSNIPTVTTAFGTGSFTTSTNNNDPFAAFRVKQQQNNTPPITQSPPTQTTTVTTNNNNNPTPIAPPTVPPPTVPIVPIINDNDIDHEAQTAFWAEYAASKANKWTCNSCSVDNENIYNICRACDVPKGQTNIQDVSSKHEVEDAMDMDEKKDNDNDNKNENNNKELFKYCEILNRNNNILEYNIEEHPKPKYFPYDHEEKKEELIQEGQVAWKQFDDSDSDSDSDEEDIKVKDNDIMDEKVKTYLEYKKRRMNCKLQINAINNKKRIKENDVLIAMCGDGSVGGQLGVGNGSVTKIHNNISPFPFIMDNLLCKTRDIRLATTGIMSTAIVTNDNQIYVWGLNDKSELTINPKNISDVDVGDDDDELSNITAWNRLYKYYYSKIENIYKKYNPNKLIEKKSFVYNLLSKRKVGKIMIKYKTKEEIKEGSLYSQDTIDKTVKQFEDKCKLEDKKSKKKYKATYTQEINIDETANEIQALYVKICNKYDISEEDRSELYIPKATASEIRDRRDRKLNPYKYLSQNNMDIDDKDKNKNNAIKPDLISMDSENIPTRHMLLRSEVKINNEIEIDSDFEYEQKQDLGAEDDFQGTLSCSYWTPACIRLPYKMVVKQITLGGTHMVVLDDLGQIWSSGTFMSDGPIGHHYDIHTKEIIRYQRTLLRISDIESQDDGLSSSRIGKNKKLPQISEIASGVNHFLMLDVYGNVWKMGVTKLGQRWCARNTKKYLCPQRVSVINIAQNRRATKRIKFVHISCGNYHNLAISTDQQLYSWGQNIWLQCGHPKDQCGYGNVVDQPRLVLFYKNKININSENEKDLLLEQHPKIQSVCAGEHMTIALDIKGRVYTCGRNACGQLGRQTRNEGIVDYGIQKVQTEVEPDFMRRVSDLNHILIDWIGCGSVFWYAHNKMNGTLYGYGDSSNGRVGIGSWKYSRGRPVFDKHNFDLKRFQIISASGGSDHCVFVIKKIPKLKHRHSIGSNYSNTNNSRENSLDRIDDNIVTKDVINQMENLQTSGNNNNNNNNNNKIPSSHQPMRRKSRKRKLLKFDECIPEEEEIMNIDDNEPKSKRRKKSVNNADNKPKLTRDITSAKTTPSPGPPSKHKKNT